MNNKLRTLILLALTFALVPAGIAADQVVTDLGDSGGPNQLRAKLTACLNSGGGTITFTLSGTILLNGTSLPTITSNVTVNGGGNIEISGNNATRIFNVAAGAALTIKNITLSHAFANGDGGAIASIGALTAQNTKFLNNATSASLSGSALLCWGPLTITNCEFGFNSGGGGAVKPRSSGAITTISDSNFHDNSSSDTQNTGAAGYGGAMQIFDGPKVTITNSTFTNNSAVREGGAIYMTDNCTLTLDSTTFTGNTSTGGGGIAGGGTVSVSHCSFSTNHATGGGAISVGGSLTADNTTFTGNTASGSIYGVGGAIFNSGTTTLTDVTLSQNVANQGGGINNNLGTVTLTRVTVVGNSAVSNGSGGGVGGGVANLSDNFGTLTATNCTFSSNSAALFGGGIYNNQFSTATLMNVTFSGNSAPASSGGNVKNDGALSMTNTILAQGGAGGNCSGTISGSSNLADDNTCGFLGVNDILLGPLADNGGLTLTHLPQPGSRAIDRGTDAGAPTTDQRGVERPQLVGVDVGAVEVVPQIFESTDPSIRYDGWSGILDPNASGGALRWSNFTNDTATYSFNATSIKWLARKGPTMGKALVTIDGTNKGMFDLYSATGSNQQFLFGGLTSAPHKIVIKVTGTKNARSTGYYVSVDGFLVGSSTKVVQENALAVQYDKWVGKKQAAASGGSYRINSSLGTAEFDFAGTSINFVTARGPSYGKVNVFIDDQLVSSNLDLYAPTQEWQYKMGYSGLANALHIIDIVPTHTKNASSKGFGIVLDAFEGFAPQQD